ncbi:uncharacterized protein LOC114717472 [Neltuma alba]|uniref:uncharacterized protein LOC114717472 n=1 Tax=Neltuma alba TaxID=207710 RepID=UPI0010A4EC05|nr:uncharacterized protein LOC114717472 [Prosopis alba]
MGSPSSYSQVIREREKQISEEREKHDSAMRQLYEHTLQGEWREVEKLYKTKPEVWSAEITTSGDTALHMAINEDKKDDVASLLDIILKADDRHRQKKVEALMKANEVGDTPLHRAAARGSVEMCKSIVMAASKLGADGLLLRVLNRWDENPIFVAVLDNRKHAFIYFLKAFNTVEDELLMSPRNGDTVLHSAIRREHYELAFHIIRKCPQLTGKCNEKGVTPLHILVSKPSAFRSGSHLSWWEAIIYHCIAVDQLKYDDSLPTTPSIRSSEFEYKPDNYKTCYQFLSILRCCGRVMAGSDPENHYNSHVKGNVPQNYATCFQFLFMVLQHIFGVLGFGKTIEEIINARQKHTWSMQILDELMRDTGNIYMTEGGIDPGQVDFGSSNDSPEGLPVPETFRKTKQDKTGENKHETQRTDTPLLVAAQKGITEVVEKILERLPVSIHDTSSKKKNIVLVAAENRQPGILDLLETHLKDVLKKPQLWQDLVRAVDTDENTILHLAAKYDESRSHPWQIHGAAMQMQWEIKWYEHVKAFPPSHFIFLPNNEGETPVQIFDRDHRNLVKSSSDWLKDTSESCSVVAALVAGVSFATSSQVPGGTDEETGKPKLEEKPAFELFAVTALIGLCFSVTALIMFLSILTSRKQYKDFRRNLPLKLLLGLSSLFVSIASMLVSFCAAHFFVLEDKFKKGVFPLYAATCLPVSFYAIAQFPLYLALLKAIVRHVPQSHHFGHFL